MHKKDIEVQQHLTLHKKNKPQKSSNSIKLRPEKNECKLRSRKLHSYGSNAISRSEWKQPSTGLGILTFTASICPAAPNPIWQNIILCCTLKSSRLISACSWGCITKKPFCARSTLPQDNLRRRSKSRAISP